MTRMLEELKQLDEQLNDIRVEKYAASITGSVSDEQNEEITEEEEEELCVSEDNASVSAEINDLFDNTASVGKMADKVNSSLHQMSKTLHSFPQDSKDVDQGQE